MIVVRFQCDIQRLNTGKKKKCRCYFLSNLVGVFLKDFQNNDEFSVNVNVNNTFNSGRVRSGGIQCVRE